MKNIAFLFLLLYTSICVNAQKGSIIYTDFEPDTCRFLQNYKYWCIDINYDGVWDLEFYGFIQMHVIFPHTKMLNGGELCLPKPDTYLNSDTLYWKSEDSWHGGMFEDRYGFRFNRDGDYYYGWMSVRCDHDPYSAPCNQQESLDSKKVLGRNIYVDKMAFCTIPNYPLRWGQTALDESVEENTYMPVAIYPNPTDGVLNISFSENTECQSVEVYAVDGSLLKSQISNLETVDVSKLNAGIYILKVNMADGREFTERIVKE